MIASGTVGSCKWEISDAGALRIYPTNGTSGSFLQGTHPWLDYASSIKTGKVESGVSVTSGMAIINGMFYGCNSLTSLDLSSFNTSAVTDMSYMFCGCNSLTSLDLSSFNTSAVTRMYSMFYGCNSLTSLDLSSFNTSAVTDMSSMFYGCNSLTSLDLSSFNTSAVTYMSYMFQGCNSLTSLDLSSFNTSAVTRMYSMFYGCNSLTSLDLSSFNTSAVTYMSSMFYGCSLLTAVIIGNSFDMSAIPNDYHHNLCMGKARNTSQSIVVTSDDDFYALTTAQRAGTWNRSVTATYKVTAARSTSETATTFSLTWATDAATTTRRLRIYKKLASASDYESTPSIDDSTTLAGRSSGNDTFTISGLSEESYDFKVELYDGTNTFLAFPSIQSVVRVADFDYSTQKLKVYGGLEVGSVDYTMTQTEYNELVTLLGGGS